MFTARLYIMQFLSHVDGEFKRYAIANFVSANKLPLLPTLTQNTVSSLDGHPIKKLACHIVYNYNWISFMHSLIPFLLLLHIYTYPLYSNQIILLAVANESSKFLPSFKEAAKSFTGKVILSVDFSNIFMKLFSFLFPCIVLY